MRAKFIFILLVLPLYSLSQEKHYGLSVGVNFTKWDGDVEMFSKTLGNEMNSQEEFIDFIFNRKMRTGLSMGLFFDFPIKKSLSVQPEISYVQKGMIFSGIGRYKNYAGTYPIQTDMIYQTDYLDFIFLAKYSFTESHIKPYLVAGPGLGYLVSSRLNVKVSVNGESDSESSKIDTGNSMDANLNFGGGIDFSDQIRLDLRYSQGLISILEDYNANGYKLHNSVISVNLVACF